MPLHKPPTMYKLESGGHLSPGLECPQQRPQRPLSGTFVPTGNLDYGQVHFTQNRVYGIVFNGRGGSRGAVGQKHYF